MYSIFLIVLACWLAVFILSIAIYFILRLRTKLSLLSLIFGWTTVLAFAFIGLAVGLLTGWSSSPVVGVIIPALLTFFGGIITYGYLFGSKKGYAKSMNGIVVSVSIAAMAFCIVYGTDYGVNIRSKAEFKHKTEEMHRQMEMETFRHNLKELDINDTPLIRPENIQRKRND